MYDRQILADDKMLLTESSVVKDVVLKVQQRRLLSRR